MKKIIVDCHTHSGHSFDSTESMETMCQTAIERGCSVLAVTDHFETALFEEPDQCSIEEIQKSADEALSMNGRFEGLKVLRGLELGHPCHDVEHAQKVLDAAEYDFVLASVHVLADKRDFYFLDYNEVDPVDIYNLYLDELLETVEYGKFDSLAHFTYPRRYMSRDKNLPDIEMFSKKTDDVLSLLAKKGKALELNSYAKWIDHKLMREYYGLVKRFGEFGGEMLTFGSDSHMAQYITGGLDFMRELAIEAGFKTGVYFVNHMPVEFEL